MASPRRPANVDFINGNTLRGTTPNRPRQLACTRRRQLSASKVRRYELPTMSRGSLPVVEFHAKPAMVESPINETGGASTGGVGAATATCDVSGSEATTTAVIVARRES